MASADLVDIAIRRAEAGDCASIWRWRNDPAARAVSVDSREIPWADHRDWYAQSLQNSARAILIGMTSDGPCGCVRFDRADGAAVVSIFLDPARLGRGLGAHLLRAGERWLRANWPDVRRIEATILPDNVRSQRAFAKAGYERDAALWVRRLSGDSA